MRKLLSSAAVLTDVVPGYSGTLDTSDPHSGRNGVLAADPMMSVLAVSHPLTRFPDRVRNAPRGEECLLESDVIIDWEEYPVGALRIRKLSGLTFFRARVTT